MPDGNLALCNLDTPYVVRWLQDVVSRREEATVLMVPVSVHVLPCGCRRHSPLPREKNCATFVLTKNEDGSWHHRDCPQSSSVILESKRP